MAAAESQRVIMPGEWYFGAAPESVRTLLGSCVAISVWHPRLHLGGLCHYLLPRPPLPDSRPDARYGIHALHYLQLAMERLDACGAYQIGCFGGSDMFAGQVQTRIGQLNVDFAHRWLHQRHLVPQQIDTGGNCSRNIMLDLATGVIILKRYDPDQAMEPFHDSTGVGSR